MTMVVNPTTETIPNRGLLLAIFPLWDDVSHAPLSKGIEAGSQDALLGNQIV